MAAGPDPGKAPLTVLRSGGLGDFLLSLPFLLALRRRHPDVLLVTRASYWETFADVLAGFAFLDIDGPEMTPAMAALERGGDTAWPWAGRRVYSFLPGLGAVTTAGAAGYCQLDSRPPAPPHVAERMFRSAGLPVPPDLERRAVLANGPDPTANTCWVHPGSGSPRKNAALDELRRFAVAALADGCREVILSFGEADNALIPPARAVFAGLPVEWVVRPSLATLRRMLASRAACYCGSDSGVSHLAAALGLPATVIFRVTDPRVWRPLGPGVRICSAHVGQKKSG